MELIETPKILIDEVGMTVFLIQGLRKNGIGDCRDWLHIVRSQEGIDQGNDLMVR